MTTDQHDTDTDTVEIDVADLAEAGVAEIPTYDLPDRGPLDASSHAALSVSDELDRQLSDHPDASVAFDPRKIADAALAVAGQWPRIPDWLGEPRRIGGTTRAGAHAPEPEVSVALGETPGTVTLSAIVTDVGDTGTTTIAGDAVVETADARTWALNVLAACSAADAAQDTAT